MHSRYDVGARVYLIPWDIPGTLVEPGVFKADNYTEGLHNGAGRGPNGFYWFVSDETINFLGQVSTSRKKTGFAKFIKRVESLAI